MLLRSLDLFHRQRADSVNTATTDETSTTADQQPHSPGSPSSPPSSGSGPSFAKLQLEGQDEILDVAACPAPAGLFELRQDRHSHVVLAAGMSPALAFYLVGSETRSIGLASIAWAVASRVTSLTVGAIDGIFGFVGLRGRGRRRRKVAASAEVSARGGSEDGDGREESPPPLVLRWDGGLQDGRRRVTSLCLDPSGRFAAAADGFGRVMLVDCATRQAWWLLCAAGMDSFASRFIHFFVDVRGQEVFFCSVLGESVGSLLPVRVTRPR